ncbi:ABC transporter permease [Mycolicibacterium litorale]|uniref:ABC transporter substrate-binding protein n=1 Tax=Mycolicibacterium litorale TaxID=758802 RepID=A0AAD1MTI4_9MYCO|nr:ABC transporter permease [Mycolicibacterium litorale]MCV7415485.1 ABC transporter permease [Mycolicibacterium litorale]TDY08740.1 ABC-type lipoprotein release transport system permease subunit [Mycolicibacterium litorale]BBY16665.1 ABC transporter substrate-binding protein [Mycolicibacterium litorale]
METSQVNNAALTRSPGIASASGNTFGCLVRFALANIRRRPERFVLSVLGIALAIACVTVVRTISSSFAITGADSVTDVLGEAHLWVVPAAGVHYDPDAQAMIADGAAPEIDVPAGWSATRILSGRAEVDGVPVSLRGSDETPSGQAAFGSALADRLGVGPGDHVDVGGRDLVADVAGPGQSVTVSTSVAGAVVGDHGWWTVNAPAGQENRRDLAQQLSAATGLESTADPSLAPDPHGGGLIYDTVGGTGPLSFEQKFSALFSGKVTSSTLGLISTIGLALGFVIALSSFLAAVAERKREFGIMSSIGLADEVLYFFLVESALVFIAAYLVGVLGAGVAVALVIPGIATPVAWAQAAGMVAAFIPAMAIVGALVPVHRLLQQRPVDLLGAR